jgi:hypothetical protein
MLCRLAGRSRALEVVLGAVDLDADTAAQYGCTYTSYSSEMRIVAWSQK